MKRIGILVFLCVLLVVFGYFTIFSSPVDKAREQLAEDFDKYSDYSPEEIAVIEQISKEKKGKGTLESLQFLGEDLECMVSYKPNEFEKEIEGTFFTSDSSIRGDFLTESPDLTSQIVSSIIIDDSSVVYIWTEFEDESYGVKMNLSVLQSGEAGHTAPVPLDEEVTYDCKKWVNVDNTVFVPPSDILFKDLGEITEEEMEYGTIYEEGL